MIKSTITLSGGLKFNVEATSPEHLMKIINKISNGEEIGVKLLANETVTQKYDATTVQVKKPGGRGTYTRGIQAPWSKRDIIETAKIIRDNISRKGGVSDMVMKHLRTEGDNKKRTDATIYTIVCDIRKYLNTGAPGAIPKRTEEILRSAGIIPLNEGSTNHSYLGVPRRITVQEA